MRHSSALGELKELKSSFVTDQVGLFLIFLIYFYFLFFLIYFYLFLSFHTFPLAARGGTTVIRI